MNKLKQMIITLALLMVLVFQSAGVRPVYAANGAQSRVATTYERSSNDNAVDMGLFLREYALFLEVAYAAYEKGDGAEWKQTIDTAYSFVADLYLLLKASKDSCYCNLGFEGKIRKYSVIYNNGNASYSVTAQFSNEYSCIDIYEFAEEQLVRKISMTIANHNGSTVILYIEYEAGSLPYTYRSMNCFGEDQESVSYSTRTLGKVDEIVFDAKAWISGEEYTWGKELLYGVVKSAESKPPANPFVDVAEDMYYYDAVLWAYNAEPQITNGMDENHFGPNNTVTRAQIVTFLWRAKGEPEPTQTENPFVDVKSSDYFYKAVLWAGEKGIVKGTDETHFTPMQTCSTAHIVTMLYRAMEVGTDGWYEEAGAWASGLGLMKDLDLTVGTKIDCPRGAIVTFLYRVLA